MVAILVSAVALGIAFSAPAGAVSAEVWRRGLAGGFRPAFLVEAGSLVGDAVWAIVALAGAAFIVESAAGRMTAPFSRGRRPRGPGHLVRRLHAGCPALGAFRLGFGRLGESARGPAFRPFDEPAGRGRARLLRAPIAVEEHLRLARAANGGVRELAARWWRRGDRSATYQGRLRHIDGVAACSAKDIRVCSNLLLSEVL